MTTKIPTKKLVDEIAEVINDESPNIARSKRDELMVTHSSLAMEKNRNPCLGFQPADPTTNSVAKNFNNESPMIEEAGSSASNRALAFDKTHSVEMAPSSTLDDSPQPVNIVYKKDQMFGVTTGGFGTTAANS